MILIKKIISKIIDYLKSEPEKVKINHIINCPHCVTRGFFILSQGKKNEN